MRDATSVHYQAAKGIVPVIDAAKVVALALVDAALDASWRRVVKTRERVKDADGRSREVRLSSRSYSFGWGFCRAPRRSRRVAADPVVRGGSCYRHKPTDRFG